MDFEFSDELLALQFSSGRAILLAGIERLLPGELVVVEQVLLV